MEPSQSWLTISLVLAQSVVALKVLQAAMKNLDLTDDTNAAIVQQLSAAEQALQASLVHEETLVEAAQNIQYQTLISSLEDADVSISEADIEAALEIANKSSESYTPS
mgnify:CR=1 FL=1